MTDSVSSTGSGQNAPDPLNLLQSRWNTVSTKATLSGISDKLTRLNDDVESLEDSLKNIRKRGYVFDKDWESQAAKIKAQWPQKKRQAEQAYDEEKENLRKATIQMERAISRAEGNTSLIDDAERKLNALEKQITAANQKIERIVSGLEDDAGTIYEGLEWAEFMLNTLDEARFNLQQGENGVAACKAQWISHKEEPEGILYLTDQRLIFEQKEEKATKKVLFITTAKELVHKKLWDAPVGGVDKVSAADKGGTLGFGVKELLTLNFNRDVDNLPDNEMTLRFKDYADNEMWVGLIGRVKSGEIEKSRYGKASAQAEATTRTDVPTQCGSCGGKLPTAFKGMQHLKCEYCGEVVNL